MKALKYEIEVTTDIIHGWKTTIEEYFLPEAGMCFNEKGGVFKKDKPRATPIEETEVPYSLVEALTAFVNKKSKAHEELDKFFKNNADLDLIL